MDNVLIVPDYGIESGMVFCDGNLSVQVTVTYLPIHADVPKNNSKDNELVYKLDLRGIS